MTADEEKRIRRYVELGTIRGGEPQALDARLLLETIDSLRQQLVSREAAIDEQAKFYAQQLVSVRQQLAEAQRSQGFYDKLQAALTSAYTIEELLRYHEAQERIASLEAELAAAQFQAKFNAGYIDTLKQLGLPERLLEEYQSQKMKIRSLEAELAETQRQLAHYQASYKELCHESCGHEERAGRLEAALRQIKDEEGRVCEEYELCHHSACQSSYTAWAIADKALAGPEGEKEPSNDCT